MHTNSTIRIALPGLSVHEFYVEAYDPVFQANEINIVAQVVAELISASNASVTIHALDQHYCCNPSAVMAHTGKAKVRRFPTYIAADFRAAVEKVAKELSVQIADRKGTFKLELRLSDAADNGENVWRDYLYIFARLAPG